MGNYRQHLTFATATGVVYALGVYLFSGVHWVFGTVAAMLTSLGGLLPDLDHPTGTQLKGFTGILAVLASVAVWHGLARKSPDLPFELHLLSVLIVYIFVRHWMRDILARVMVHRGILHSFPCCAVWGAATYLYYPSDNHLIRIIMATAVMVGFLSHLLLDEMFSVDIHNTRIKQSFGTAMKFWAPSLSATFAMYILLSVVAWQVIQVWPEGSFRSILAQRTPTIVIPWPSEEGHSRPESLKPVSAASRPARVSAATRSSRSSRAGDRDSSTGRAARWDQKSP